MKKEIIFSLLVSFILVFMPATGRAWRPAPVQVPRSNYNSTFKNPNSLANPQGYQKWINSLKHTPAPAPTPVPRITAPAPSPHIHTPSPAPSISPIMPFMPMPAAVAPGTSSPDAGRSAQQSSPNEDIYKEAYEAQQRGDWDTYNRIIKGGQAGHATPEEVQAFFRGGYYDYKMRVEKGGATASHGITSAPPAAPTWNTPSGAGSPAGVSSPQAATLPSWGTSANAPSAPTWNTSTPPPVDLTSRESGTLPAWKTTTGASAVPATVQSAIPDKLTSAPTWNMPPEASVAPTVPVASLSTAITTSQASSQASLPGVPTWNTSATSHAGSIEMSSVPVPVALKPQSVVLPAAVLPTNGLPVWNTPSQTANIPGAVSTGTEPEALRQGTPADRDSTQSRHELTLEEIELLLNSRPYREYERDSGPKKVKETKQSDGLTREKLEKLNCDVLAAMLGGLKGNDARLCREVMNAKCRAAITLAAGAEKPAIVVAPQAPVSAVQSDPKSVLAKVALASVNSMEHDAEMENLYKELGMTPPKYSEAEELMNNISKALDAKVKADSEYVTDNVESVADIVTGYKSPKQSDPSGLSIDLGYAKPKTPLTVKPGTSSTASDKYAYSAGAYIPSPMDLDSSPGVNTKDQVLITHLFDSQGELSAANPSALALAVHSAQGDSSPISKTWDGKSSPQHGQKNDKGQYWSSNYGQWVNQDIFMMDEEIKVKQEQFKTDMKNKAVQEQKAVAAKEDILDKAKKYRSEEDLKKLSMYLDQQIANGITAEDLMGSAKKFMIQEMEVNQYNAKTANAEADKADRNLTLAKAGVSLATAPYGIVGMATEIGVYTYAGSLDGNAKAGFIEGAWANVPGSNTYNWYKNYSEGKASSYGILSALVFDGLTAAGTFSTYQDLKKGNLLGSSYAGIGLGLGGKAANIIDDGLAVWNKANAQEKGMLLARAKGQNKVNEFNGLFGEAYNDAMRKKGIFNIDDYPELKFQAWKIQQDPAAIHMLNKMDPEAIHNFNNTIKCMYGKVDNQVQATLEASAKAKYGSNFDKIETVKATNQKPSNVVKASFDQDITYRVYRTDGTFNDVPSGELQKLVNKFSYEEAGSPALKSFDPDGIGEILLSKTDAKGVRISPAPDEVFAFMGGQTATTRLSADAYGHSPYQLESVLYFKEEMFLGNMQYSGTFIHKGSEWFDHASKVSKAADAAEAAGDSAKALALRGHESKFIEEGTRQLTKQWNGQALPAMEKVNAACKELSIATPKIPPAELNKAMELMGTIGKVDPVTGRIITPEIVSFQIKNLGNKPPFAGIEDVGKKAADYLQGYEHHVKNNRTLADNLAKKGLDARKTWNMDPTKTKVLEKDPINDYRAMK